jgi:transglutaminase-like putative cysteine protease
MGVRDRRRVPRPDIDYLASTGGTFSPIFAEAVAAGVFAARLRAPVSSTDPTTSRLPGLPERHPGRGAQPRPDRDRARATTFEKALILESWLRDPRNFTYSTDVDTGHTSLDLADWLLDPDSRNYRTGYCEQFATAMAVMARTLGIPSRVVLGFTPGDVQQQADGTDVIVVRERNAHAWVELWMNGQGWVRFDPTPRSDGATSPLVSDVGFDLREYVPAPAEIDSSGSPSAGRNAPTSDPRSTCSAATHARLPAGRGVHGAPPGCGSRSPSPPSSGRSPLQVVAPRRRDRRHPYRQHRRRLGRDRRSATRSGR